MAASLACVLAIGGLDPGGGAGVVADLRALAHAGVFGCAVVAVQTVQSTAGLREARAVPGALVGRQIAEVIRAQTVRAIKVGALGSADNVGAVATVARRHPGVPLVLDTPMLPSRGRRGVRLLSSGAVRALREELLPRATLVTVNAAEATALIGEPVRTVGEAHDAARWLVRTCGARAALVKGGHLDDASAVDVLAAGDEVLELRARRLAGPGVHGTGCTLASLVAARLAVRAGARVSTDALVDAVRWAKRAHFAELSRATQVGKGRPVLAFAGRGAL